MAPGHKPEDVWEGRLHPEAFEELIHFSDCEGTIGPKTSAKLAKDFADWRDRAEKHTPEEYFFAKYCDFQKAFEIAARGGAVKFS